MKLQVLTLVGFIWYLGCAPVDADLSADAESDAPGVSPAYESRSVQFEVGEPWVLLKSEIPGNDPSHLQLVQDNHEIIAIDFQKNLSFWGTGADGLWEPKLVNVANPFVKAYDAFTYNGTLFAAGLTSSGVALYKMTEARQFQLVDEIPGKSFSTACVIHQTGKIHIIGREDSSAFIQHYVWESGKAFAELKMSNLVPSTATIDCVYHNNQFFLLYQTSQDNKRPASLWRSPMGVNWSKISHDVSTDLGFVSMYKGESEIIISGQDAYMSSKDGKNWRYFETGAVKFTEKFDSVDTGTSLLILANSLYKSENKVGLWALSSSNLSPSLFKKSSEQLRAGEGEIQQQVNFQSKRYFIKRKIDSFQLERLEDNETIIDASIAAGDSTTMKFAADDSRVYKYSDDGTLRRVQTSDDLQTWSDFVFNSPMPAMDRPCFSLFDEKISFVAATTDQPKMSLFRYESGNWLETNSPISSAVRIESCFILGNRIGIIAKSTAGKFLGFTIHPTHGLVEVPELIQFMEPFQSTSEFKMISGQGDLALLSSENFIIIDDNFNIRSGAHGLGKTFNIVGGYFRDSTLQILSPSFFPLYFDRFSYKFE